MSDMQVRHTVTRRDFAKGVMGAGAIGAAITGIAGFPQAAHATTPAGLPQQWDQEADVVVIGFGMAGTTAACEVADAGMEALIIEKAPETEAGGATLCNGGFMTISITDPDKCYRAWKGAYDRDVIEARLASWPLMREWLDANPIEGLQSLGDGEFDGYMCPEGSWKIYPGLKDAVSRRSIPVMYETQAIDFIQDTETREIKGVWAKQGETVIAIKARRAVVLATGSYTGSPELVKRFSRAGMFIPNYDSPHNTGDGIYMATRAGAQLWGFSSECLDFQDWAIKPASEEVGTGIRYLQPTEEAPGHIIVNKAGVRFMNELVNTRHTRAHMPVFDWDDSALEYINSPFWMVFGQDFMDTQRIGAYGTTPEVDPAYGTVVTFTWNGVLKSYLWSMDNSAELEKGWIVTGETLDELAANMRTTNAFGDEVSVDPEGLKATVEQYNALCESGEDDPLGRPSGSMAPIGDGHYYAVELCPAVMYANGGPQVDTENRVINQDGEPIGRLYAAGQVCVTFNDRSSVPNALTAGVQCGRSAAALEPWE